MSKSISFVLRNTNNDIPFYYNKFDIKYCKNFYCIVKEQEKSGYPYYYRKLNRYRIFARIYKYFDNCMILEHAGRSMADLLLDRYKKDTFFRKKKRFWKFVIKNIFRKLEKLSKKGYVWSACSLDNIIISKEARVRFINPKLIKSDNALYINKKLFKDLIIPYKKYTTYFEECSYW